MQLRRWLLASASCLLGDAQFAQLGRRSIECATGREGGLGEGPLFLVLIPQPYPPVGVRVGHGTADRYPPRGGTIALLLRALKVPFLS
eukprot:scaffold254867_cov37-Tisochrysis_lutea.AAC.1